MKLWHRREPTPEPHPALTRAAHAGLYDWLCRPPGLLLAEAEQAVFDRIVPDLFGYHVLQIGRMGTTDPMSGSRIHHRILLDIQTPRAGQSVPALHAEADALPFAADSIDVVLLPHVLEFEPRPHDALRESFRVLAPEGHLLLSVFNPSSLLGLSRLSRRHRRRPPWSGQFLILARLRDWLALLGFDVVDTHARFFAPPFRNAAVLGRLLRSERHLARVCPLLAGTHIVLARKRVFTLTRVRERWRPSKRLVTSGLAEPTARGMRLE